MILDMPAVEQHVDELMGLLYPDQPEVRPWLLQHSIARCHYFGRCPDRGPMSEDSPAWRQHGGVRIYGSYENYLRYR